MLRARFPNDGYVAYHAPRYARLLAIVDALLPRARPPILDVGKSRFTTVLAEHLRCRVDTLGLPDEADEAGTHHYHFDLNDTQHRARWRSDVPRYPLIVFAEVLEHLHTSPRLVLGFLRELLTDGGVIVLQTPNAAAFHKRVRLLLGRQPYELFREDLRSPGHYREYTACEIAAYAAGSGFVVEELSFESYFDYRFRRHGPGQPVLGGGDGWGGVANVFYGWCPGGWRPGIMAVVRR